MEDPQRLGVLRGILLVKWIVTLFVWGLPALIGPPALFALFRMAFPSDPVFLRLFGAVVTALALAYWFAWKDPVRNVAIIKFGVLDNGFVTVTIVILALTTGISSWYFWASGVLTLFFCVSFLLLMPREGQGRSA